MYLADYQSRKRDDNKEWSLTATLFDKIVNILGTPNIDLFASRTNKKLNTYVSWNPDPGCVAVDAFSLNWKDYKPYCFPPFSQIGRTIAKIRQDKVSDVILIAPLWRTQSWYP